MIFYMNKANNLICSALFTQVTSDLVSTQELYRPTASFLAYSTPHCKNAGPTVLKAGKTRDADAYPLNRRRMMTTTICAFMMSMCICSNAYAYIVYIYI